MHLTSPRDIRAARLDIGLSQAEAAQIVGVSESTWQQWETNPMFSSYEQISFDSWQHFLFETNKLRAADSQWRLREVVVRESDCSLD